MKRDRNHEGYHDPTAGSAIRRASRRRKKVLEWSGLTYQLGELESFKEAVKGM